MMTATEKTAKAKEILNSNPSEEDLCIAVGLTKEAAEKNDAEALYVMGRLFYQGIGVEADDKKAFAYSQKALEAGCEKAKTVLAVYYIMDKVVKRNLPLAEKYLRDRIAADDSFAYGIMGDFVFQNVFPDIEWSTFADYFKKAISLGEHMAMLFLAEKYNLICQPEQADYWYQRAAEAGVKGVEGSKAKFTEENYQERRQNVLNFYTDTGRYDEVFALVNRDYAAGDESARWLKAALYAQGLGEEAYGRDLPRALNMYERLAEEGEPHADFLLGLLYYNAEEIKNPQKSLRYMQKAAGEGHANALFIMASNYLYDPEIRTKPDYNFGLEKNETLGFELLQKAAEGDDANALFSMHLCCRFGKHWKQDDEKAFALLEHSSNLEITPEKACLLGDMYEEGKGTEQDYEKAVQCYQWASDNGNFHAAEQLASMYKEGKGVEQNAEMANFLFNRAHELMGWQLYGIMPLEVVLAEARKGDPQAMFQLAGRYREGNGVEQDMEKAAAWWKKASDKGVIPAKHNLGIYYLEKDDIPNAKKFLEAAVSAGDLDSYFALGNYYLHHADEVDNVQKGIDLLEEAAEESHAESQWQLLSVFYNGTYGTKDFDKARYWLEKGLQTDFPKAHYALAASLAQGTLYPKDLDKALEHYRKAVELGCHEANDDYISMRWFGNEAEKNREEVIGVYRQLAKNDDAVAMFCLYKFYYDDTYEGHDNKLAALWLKMSADAGYDEAMITMGQQLLGDELFTEDKEAAFNCFASVAKTGNTLAQAWLGYCYKYGYGTEKDFNKATELLTPAAKEGMTFAVINLVSLYIFGEEGSLEPDCDKAIEVLQPFLECDNSMVNYYMALALSDKCSMKNGYSWKLASQAFSHMKRAAEAGDVVAMDLLSCFYLRGEGTIADDDEAKKWLQKCLEIGGKISDSFYPEYYSAEKFPTHSKYSKVCYWKELAENNIHRIENPLEMEDSEGTLEVWNIMLNVSQLGENNALIGLHHCGMDFLKTEPERAKTFITAACKGGFPESAYHAGMEWLKDGIENETSLQNAIEYFSLGTEHRSLDCFLQLGLILTDERFEGKWGYRRFLKHGVKMLQAVSVVEGDDFEEQRQQARTRLAEVEQRPKSAWTKFINALASIFQ